MKFDNLLDNTVYCFEKYKGRHNNFTGISQSLNVDRHLISFLINHSYKRNRKKLLDVQMITFLKVAKMYSPRLVKEYDDRIQQIRILIIKMSHSYSKKHIANEFGIKRDQIYRFISNVDTIYKTKASTVRCLEQNYMRLKEKDAN